MPHFDASQKISSSDLEHLKNQVPSFPSSLVSQSTDNALGRYFQLYGFHHLLGEHVAAYHFGQLTLQQYQVFAHCWRLDRPSGTVFLAHGLFDHIGLYLDLIDDLLKQGLQVIAFDFPGHGLSTGKPASITDFSDYGRMIREFLVATESMIHGPLYGLGQSTGAAALLNYVFLQNSKGFEKQVLLAPLVRPRGWRWVSFSHLLLHRYLEFVPRGFSVNSHHSEFCAFLENDDPLQSRKVSVEWVGAMKAWVSGFNDFDCIDVKTLIYQGDNDNTVMWESNIPLIKSKLSHCDVHIIKGAMHHLVNEGDAWRGPMFSGISRFFCGT